MKESNIWNNCYIQWQNKYKNKKQQTKQQQKQQQNKHTYILFA